MKQQQLSFRLSPKISKTDSRLIIVRNRLVTSTISSLLMITCINGPPLANFNAKKYVISWLKKGRHGAEDKPTGKKSKTRDVAESSKLFI